MEEYGNSQNRAYLLTINNPKENGLDHEKIKQILSSMNLTYYGMCDETGLITKTYHTHVYFRSKNGIRFKTVKNKFPTAHIDACLGSAQENRDYIRKEGKYKDSDKSETNHIETFEEWGKMPSPIEEKDEDKAELINLITEGKTNYEIIHELPRYALKTKDIDILRNVLLTDKYRREYRQVYVHYWYGKSGVGKTRGIYRKYGAEKICRITNYPKNKDIYFDAYINQPVLVLDEFKSQIPIESMLTLLDIYPIMLNARYVDRVACYTEVYITSNVPFDELYLDIQEDYPEQWNAFKRRVHEIVEFCDDGTTITHKNEEPKELVKE